MFFFVRRTILKGVRPFQLWCPVQYLSPTWNRVLPCLASSLSAVMLASLDTWLNLPTDCLWRYFIVWSKQSSFKLNSIITNKTFHTYIHRMGKIQPLIGFAGRISWYFS
jgi:hypothetical protein